MALRAGLYFPIDGIQMEFLFVFIGQIVPLLFSKEVPKTDSSKIRVLNVTNSRGSEQKGCLSDYLIYKFDTYEKE